MLIGFLCNILRFVRGFWCFVVVGLVWLWVVVDSRWCVWVCLCGLVKLDMLLSRKFLNVIFLVMFMVILLIERLMLLKVSRLRLVVVMLMLVVNLCLDCSWILFLVKVLIVLVIIEVWLLWMVLNMLVFGIVYRCWFYGL